MFTRLVRCISSLPPPVVSPNYCNSSSRILTVGDTFKLKRSFSAADVLEYSRVTGDANPLHLDAELARDTGFEGSIVHGMLVASLFPTLIASHFPGAIYASQTLQFKSPVYTNDQLEAEVQSLNLKANKNRYIAKFLTRCYKNGEQLVIHGEALAILPTLAYKE